MPDVVCSDFGNVSLWMPVRNMHREKFLNCQNIRKVNEKPEQRTLQSEFFKENVNKT